METGTGKTYVYLRTIQELRARYQLRKFIIVVPSVAIYEGVVKSGETTKEHFKGLYSNEVPRVIEYESGQISQLRDFATSDQTVVLLMTVDSFNKASNNVYKPTEKLPGEWLPYQYIQAVRPVLILDESQNYQSTRARQALRTLKPLFALNYSATPGKRTNLFYRLGPLEAFQQGLVKKIEVLGVTEQDNFNDDQLHFTFADVRGRYGLQVDLEAVIFDKGEPGRGSVRLKKGDDLYSKTKNPEHEGLVIEEILKNEKAVLINGERFVVNEAQAARTKRDVFRTQIEETIKHHFAKQRELNEQGMNVKVLSLFFIDRVANYTASDGMIRELFDAAYDKLKKDNNFFKGWKAEEVRAGYFAQKKATKTAPAEYIDTAIDETEKKKDDREAEKQAYHLIMQAKEKLLSFDEKVSFIFAHSALKEGWDNPNVFQICTLNQTTSESKKRQEIGRGLRLCVDQSGQRVTTDHVNVLTVVANESYEAFANKLQAEYDEAGQTKPPMPSNANKKAAKRNNTLYKSKEFKAFWDKLVRKAEYEILVDPKELVTACVHQLNKVQFPEPHVVVSSGRIVISTVRITLLEVKANMAKLDITISNTEGEQSSNTAWHKAGDDLARKLKEPRLKGYKLVEVNGTGTDGQVVFGDKGALLVGQEHSFNAQPTVKSSAARREEAQEDHPVFNLIDRCAQETKLTRNTVLSIFKQMDAAQKAKVFRNPEGFSGLFIRTVRELLADHIADRLEYHITQAKTEVDLEKLFPAEKKYPQKELVEGSKASLYDLVQVDSDVETRFVKHRMNEDQDELMKCYLKFPSGFKIDMPKLIGDYNPDWGIIRKQAESDVTVELVRETKGTTNIEQLQWSHEKRKIKIAKKYFKALGVDYRTVDGTEVRWWEKG
jgi:type III restriction enzyme